MHVHELKLHSSKQQREQRKRDTKLAESSIRRWIFAEPHHQNRYYVSAPAAVLVTALTPASEQLSD